MNATRTRAVAAFAALAAVSGLVAMLVVVPALATPPSGVTQERLSAGELAAVHAKAKDQADKWSVQIQTKGLSDLITVRVTLQPGGTLGWHSHPGFDIATVVSGTATYYEADDPICTPQVVTAGHVRFNPAGDVHTLRNEGTVPLVFVANLLVPDGAAPRIDEPDPGNCSF